MDSCRQAERGDHGQEDVVLHPREEQTSEQQDQHRPQQGEQVCVALTARALFYHKAQSALLN